MRNAGTPTNLDRLGYYRLEAIIWGVREHPRRYALTLFPSRPQHYVTAAKLLALYALELLEARRYRAQGHFRDAGKVRERCRAIYNKLPACARWKRKAP
jgi:hypothetical protein